MPLEHTFHACRNELVNHLEPAIALLQLFFFFYRTVGGLNEREDIQVWLNRKSRDFFWPLRKREKTPISIRRINKGSISVSGEAI
jgi:hypothetical protein